MIAASPVAPESAATLFDHTHRPTAEQRANLAAARRAIRAYERARHDMRSAAYAVAAEELAAFVRSRGGRIQVDGVRYEWCRWDGLSRRAIRTHNAHVPPPTLI